MNQIGRYEILGELGRGGMGVVLEARDPLLKRTVAIKTMRMDQEINGKASDRQEELLREAQAAGALSHPNIVVVYDVGQNAELIYFAMERVLGPTLQQLIKKRTTLPRAEAIAILRQVAEALDYAHMHGVVHRDIKPSNIMIHGANFVKITDFGIAKVEHTLHHTRTGLLKGTPGYMAPEQINGHAVDGRADQFSLGVIAFELLTGKRPFDGPSLGAVLHKVLNVEPPSASQVTRSLPAAVDSVLSRALAKKPEDRHESCRAFVGALDAILSSSGQSPTETLPIVPMRPASSSRIGFLKEQRSALRFGVIGVAGSAALVLGGMAVSSLWKQSPVPAPITVEFNITPAIASRGEPVTLAWRVAGAASVVIDHGIGEVSDVGQRQLVPTENTLYWLTARNGAQKQTGSVEVRLAGVPKRGAPELVASREPAARSAVPPPPDPSKLREKASGPPSSPPVIIAPPPVATQPRQGTILWTGRLLPGEQVTVKGNSASNGTVSAPFPEEAVRVEVLFPRGVRVLRQLPGELVLENAGNTTAINTQVRWTRAE